MRQELYSSDYGLDARGFESCKRCFMMLANAEQWLSATKEEPPLRKSRFWGGVRSESLGLNVIRLIESRLLTLLLEPFSYSVGNARSLRSKLFSECRQMLGTFNEAD